MLVQWEKQFGVGYYSAAKRKCGLSGERSVSSGLGQKCHGEINYKDLPFLSFFIFRATTEGFVLHWGFPQSCPKLVPAER